MHKPIDGLVLYLDFAGVLYPGAMYRINGQIIMLCEGVGLFEWAPVIADSLEP